jgi:hypothetical protein
LGLNIGDTILICGKFENKERKVLDVFSLFGETVVIVDTFWENQGLSVTDYKTGYSIKVFFDEYDVEKVKQEFFKYIQERNIDSEKYHSRQLKAIEEKGIINQEV